MAAVDMHAAQEHLTCELPLTCAGLNHAGIYACPCSIPTQGGLDSHYQAVADCD